MDDVSTKGEGGSSWGVINFPKGALNLETHQFSGPRGDIIKAQLLVFYSTETKLPRKDEKRGSLDNDSSCCDCNLMANLTSDVKIILI